MTTDPDPAAAAPPSASDTETAIGDLLYEQFFAHGVRFVTWHIANEKYVPASADDLASLGFDPDEDRPFVIVRERDGAAFKVDVSARTTQLYRDPEVAS